MFYFNAFRVALRSAYSVGYWIGKTFIRRPPRKNYMGYNEKKDETRKCR